MYGRWLKCYSVRLITFFRGPSKPSHLTELSPSHETTQDSNRTGTPPSISGESRVGGVGPLASASRPKIRCIHMTEVASSWRLPPIDIQSSAIGF